MTHKKKLLIYNYLFFSVLLLLYMAVTLFLFHRQSVSYDGKYASDIHPYIAEMQGIDSGYDFPYPILFLTGRFFSLFTPPHHAMALAITFLNALTAPVLKYYLDKFLNVPAAVSCKKGILSSLSVFSMLFVSMLYPLTYLGRYNELGENYLYRYLGTFTPNPYHNATYLAARPFSILAFFSFLEILEFYEKEDKWFHPKYLMLGTFLFLSTMAKPSFTLVFAATAGLIMLYRLVRSRFHGIKAFFQCGIWFIPTFCALLYQFGDVFQSQGAVEKGIGFGFLTAWSTACDNIPRAILLATAFPFTVLLFCIMHREFPPILRFAWQFFLISLLTLMFLYEKGYRLIHINFSWGYMYGLFFLYLISLLVLARKSFEQKQPVWQLSLQWIMYGLHFLCGIDYFRILLSGGLFH